MLLVTVLGYGYNSCYLPEPWKYPSSKIDKLNKRVREGVILLAVSLSILTEMLSGPLAFSGFRLVKRQLTSSCVHRKYSILVDKLLGGLPYVVMLYSSLAHWLISIVPTT